MFKNFVVSLALCALLFLNGAIGSSIRKVSVDGSVYEFIDDDKKNSLHASLNEDGSAPIQLSDADLDTLSNLLSFRSESNLAAGNNERKEEPLHMDQKIEIKKNIKPVIRADANSRTNPGAVLRLTKKGLDYGTETGTRLLEKYVRTAVIRDFESNGNDLKSKIENLKLTQFAMPTLSYRLISPSSLAFQSNGGSAAVRGDFKFEKKIFIWFTFSGWFEASISNLGIDIETQLNGNEQGKPQISNVDCSVDMGDLNFKIHGVELISWILDLFHDVIKNYLKNFLQAEACKKIEEFGKERGNDFLSKMVTDVKLFDGLRLDYRLTGPPNVHEPFFDLPLKGETTTNKTSSTPFTPNALELPSTESKMAAIFMSDYVLNSFLYQAHKAGLDQFQLEKYQEIADLLRTTCNGSEMCIGNFMPTLRQKHPNTIGRLTVRTSTHPTMQFMPERANLVADMVAELKFANETSFSFNVHGDFDLNSIQVTRTDNKITAKAAINDLKVTNIQPSDPDLMSDGQMIVGFVRMGEAVARAKLSKLGETGFPLPAWRGLQLENIDISFLTHTFSVACDILYSPN